MYALSCRLERTLKGASVPVRVDFFSWASLHSSARGALMFGGTARDGAARGRGAGRREGADGTVVRPRGRRVGWAGLGPRGLKRCCSAELTIFLGVVFPSTGEADARRGWSAVKLTRSYSLALANTRRCLLTPSLAVNFEYN